MRFMYVATVVLFVMLVGNVAYAQPTNQTMRLLNESITLQHDNQLLLSNHIIQLEREVQLMQVQLSNLQQMMLEMLSTDPWILH